MMGFKSHRGILLILSAMILLNTPVAGAKILEFKFGSKEDFFRLQKVDGKWTMNGKQPVSLKPFMDFVPLFSQTMEFQCEGLPKRPDLSVTAVTEITEVKRHFYVDQGVVSDGTNCLEVAGDGIYFVPYHKHWFTGSKRVKVKMGDRIELTRDGQPFLSFAKQNKEWRNENAEFFTNWDFFDKFYDMVKTMNIVYRLHPAFAKDKPSFEMITAGKTYTFYKVKERMWAVKLPTTPWLITSNKWSHFENMELSLWRSPQWLYLKALTDKKLSEEQRIQSISDIGNIWTRTVKHAYQNILLDSDDSANIKYKVMRVMRTHPTDDNMVVIAKALSKTTDIRLLNYMTKSLRIKNPKGPVITDEDDPPALEDKVEAWEKWAGEL